MKNDEKKMRRGIYLLPSLFTVAGLFSGFYSIVASTKGLYLPAAMWVFVAMICDGLDGRVARLTNTQSEFGSQLDSMSDMVCFGIAPALLVYLWSLSELGKVGWLSAFWFAMCSALRLARFNSKTENNDFSSTVDEKDEEKVKATITWPIIKGGENISAIKKATFNKQR